MKNSFRRVVYAAASVIILYGLVFNFTPSGATSGAARAARPFPEVQSPEPTARPQARGIEVTELGDPDVAGETFTVDEHAINDALNDWQPLAAFPSEQRKYKDARRVAEGMLDYALGLTEREPPVTRRSNPRQIQQFVGLFGYRSEKVPFCAMGVAFAAAKAYCDLTPEKIPYSGAKQTRTFKTVLPLINKYYFAPSASCWFMMKEAMKRKPTQRGGWIAKGKRTPKRGWLVLFDWNNGDGVPDHVGIVNGVVGRRGSKLHTVEFNTSITFGSQRNGGAVAKKVRSMDDVLGFIRTY